ncbi:hypothetical protein L226DRAFT_520630 [Lentinus tigrinus ALCF2SS1-7]|uniref:Carbohydrate-binding module family 19 domain-containing protein n=1 Tax=Lentinus tigrinus ALCF2SS1-6 TaxID=1328759 RepID=A0A5C2SR58_9APHY|nr:hypothetical protein L227DRAFT_367081 [Lentinus tigrinus ALCF2SS1-6]RPD78211.1 hypothetical protein L226DRAFT_520630 [Lentinus tigrinus ALCF2SS1-7]
MKCSVFVALSLALAASARPKYFGRADFTLQNGQDAIALNQKFATLTPDSPCNAGDNACVNSEFAQCVNGKFVLQPCAGGLVCAALPLVNSPGTSVTCTTAADRDARIAATGAQAGGAAGSAPPAPPSSPPAASSTAAAPPASSSAAAGDNAAGGGAATGGADAQTSLTLLNSVIATGFANDGQDQPTAGQVASLTSTNNFINFCATVPNLKITNGQQITEGSCNPAPMGVIASTANMPSSKFVFPPNGATVAANTNFTIKMAIKNLETGNFVNAQQNYFSAPQFVNAQGNIQGHSHVVIDPLPALDSTTPTDPLKDFVFFKGLNDKDVGGILSVEVAGGLPAGFYRLASINSAANHQPALVAVAQHGSLDDMVYFTVA